MGVGVERGKKGGNSLLKYSFVPLKTDVFICCSLDFIQSNSLVISSNHSNYLITLILIEFIWHREANWNYPTAAFAKKRFFRLWKSRLSPDNEVLSGKPRRTLICTARGLKRLHLGFKGECVCCSRRKMVFINAFSVQRKYMILLGGEQGDRHVGLETHELHFLQIMRLA